MILFRLIFSLLVPTILGAGFLWLILPRGRTFRVPLFRRSDLLGFSEKSRLPIFLILSFALGAGLTTYLMFWWGLAGGSLRIFVIGLTLVAAALVLLQNFRNLRKPGFRRLKPTGSDPVGVFRPRSRLTFIEIILILIILFEIVFVFSAAVLRPVINYDAFSTWGWKAKVFFIQPQEAFTPDSALFLGGESRQNYPLHIPLLMTWTYLGMGEINDVLINLIFAVYFLALLGFVYISLRSFVSRKISLIFTVFLATLPLLAYHGFAAYADLTLVFYFTLAAIFLFKYMYEVQPRTSNLILAGIFAGLTTWVKNEGLMLAGILLIVLLIYLVRRVVSWVVEKGFSQVGFRLKPLAVYLLYFAIFFLPWFILKKFLGMGYATGGAEALEWSGFHPEIFPKLFEYLFLLHSFHLWPGIFILILFFNLQKVFVKHNFYLLLIILGVLAGYLTLYLFTASYQYVLNGMAVGRNFLTLMPISIFLSAILVKAQK